MNAADPGPTVAAVHSNGKHDFSKTSKESIRLIEGHGVEGDAHAGATDQHLYHIRQFGHTPNLRQVHLIQAELFEELQAKGHIVKPGDLGENISTLGVDLLSLPAGARLRIGAEAVLEVTGLRNRASRSRASSRASSSMSWNAIRPGWYARPGDEHRVEGRSGKAG